jgi:hypothetical protein
MHEVGRAFIGFYPSSAGHCSFAFIVMSSIVNEHHGKIKYLLPSHFLPCQCSADNTGIMWMIILSAAFLLVNKLLDCVCFTDKP